MKALASFAGKHPELDQIELNPLLLYEKGLFAVDVRIFSQDLEDGLRIVGRGPGADAPPALPQTPSPNPVRGPGKRGLRPHLPRP